MSDNFQIWMELLGWTALHLIWQMVAIAALVYLCVQLMPKRAYQTRLAIYGSGMVAVVLASLMTFAWEWSQWTESIAAETSGLEGMQLISLTPTAESITLFDWLGEQSALLGMIWLAGLVLFAIYRAGGFWMLRKFKRDAEPVSAYWQNKVDTLIAKVGRAGQLPIRLSRDLSSPVLAGLLQPVILMPLGMWQVFDEDEIECILFHEFVHWARYDQWIHMAVVGFESLFFFHPLTWWWGKEVRQLQELIVDREVVRLGAQPKTYAQSLFKAQQWNAHQHLPAPAFGRKKGQLLERIEHLLNTRSTMRTRTIRTEQWSMAFMVGLLLLSGAWSTFAAGEEKAVANSVEVCIEEKNDECTTSERPSTTYALSDSLPEKKEVVKVDDLEITFDENGNPREVFQTRKNVNVKIEKTDGKEEQVTRTERIEKNAVEYEEKLKLTRKEDGTVDTTHQIIVRKPSKKEKFMVFGDQIEWQEKDRFIVRGHPRMHFPQTKEFKFEVMELPELRSGEKGLERRIELEIQQELGNDLEDRLEEWMIRKGLSEEEIEIKVDGERLVHWIEALGGEIQYKFTEGFQEGEPIDYEELDGDIDWIEVRKNEGSEGDKKIIILGENVIEGEEVINGFPNASKVIIRKSSKHPGTERMEGKRFITVLESDTLPEWADREAYQVRLKEMEARMRERMAREEERIAQMQAQLRKKAKQMELNEQQQQEIMEMTQKMERMLQEGWKERQEELRMMERELREKAREMDQKIMERRRLRKGGMAPPPAPEAPEKEDK